MAAHLRSADFIFSTVRSVRRCVLVHFALGSDSLRNFVACSFFLKSILFFLQNIHILWGILSEYQAACIQIRPKQSANIVTRKQWVNKTTNDGLTTMIQPWSLIYAHWSIPLLAPFFNVQWMHAACTLSEPSEIWADPEGGQGIRTHPPTQITKYKVSKKFLSGSPEKSQSYQAKYQCWAIIGTPAKRHWRCKCSQKGIQSPKGAVESFKTIKKITKRYI